MFNVATLIELTKGNKKSIISVLVALIVGVGFGRYATPEKVKTEYEKVFVDKIVTVEKKVYVKVETKTQEKKKNKKTRKVTKPDGTVIEETIESEEDSTFAGVDERAGEEKGSSSETTSTNKKLKDVKYDTKRLSVSVLAGINASDRLPSEAFNDTSNLMYGVHATYQFMGPFSVGAFGTTTKEFGISVGISF